MTLIATINKVDKEKEHQRLRKKAIGTVNFTMRVPKDIHKKLKPKLATDGITFKDLIMCAVDLYFKGKLPRDTL